MAGCLVLGLFAHTGAQSIKDYTFVTKQSPLRMGVPTVISIRNIDPERHDFGSPMFDGISTKVESGGIISYGRGIEDVFLDPKGDAMIRFT
jgi:hypothetical protein